MAPLACQCSPVSLALAVAVGRALPRVRAFFLEGMTAMMIGTFIMAAAAILGARSLHRGAEIISLIVGGVGFMFGVMWFGSGIQQLRGK